MGYERYPRTNDSQRDHDYGHDYGSGRDYTYSSARDYAAAGRDDDRHGARDRDSYGARDYYGGERHRGDRGGDRDRGFGQRPPFGDRSRGEYGRPEQARGEYGRSSGRPYRGSYASDGHRFADYDRDSGREWNRERDRGAARGRPEGHDDDRGFLDRAGDEIRSWFGDEEAERRRERDQRLDEQRARESDDHYRNWRSERLAEFDRDYDEYRRESSTKFGSEFGTWRTERQGQRDHLNKVDEHMEVVGSDGEHVGTVDKVRGDRIVLTRNDADAGGHHHSIPSRWIDSVDDKVKIRKTAAEAKREWRDEERAQAFGNDRNPARTDANQATTPAADKDGNAGPAGSGTADRSFSRSY